MSIKLYSKPYNELTESGSEIIESGRPVVITDLPGRGKH